jgi:hypothetical protein
MKGMKNTAKEHSLADVLEEIRTQNLPKTVAFFLTYLVGVNGIIMYGKLHSK